MEAERAGSFWPETRANSRSSVVRAPRAFVDQTLWPEYLALQEALHSYLNEATERIIREEVYKDAGEAPERAG